MNNYTIYCTQEQTLKAMDLGAPIKHIHCRGVVNIETYLLVEEIRGYNIYVEIPTAEQMIGWLEVQKYISSIEVSHQYGINKYCYYIFDDYGNDIESLDSKIRFNSRPEATLAVIDAALEYLHLHNNKKN